MGDLGWLAYYFEFEVFFQLHVFGKKHTVGIAAMKGISIWDRNHTRSKRPIKETK